MNLNLPFLLRHGSFLTPLSLPLAQAAAQNAKTCEAPTHNINIDLDPANFGHFSPEQDPEGPGRDPEAGPHLAGGQDVRPRRRPGRL